MPRPIHEVIDARSTPVPPTIGVAWSRGRLMGALFAAQVCGSTGHSIAMAVGGIMAAEITGANAWTGLPVAVGALGTALASWPLARLMAHAGRRPGLAVGYGLAVVGAALGMAGVLLRSFPLFLFGMALFGIANTSNLLARYAAADVTPGARRGRAMGLIVWGSTAGSIIGPNLMGPAVEVGRPLGLSPVGSAFLISLAGYGLASLLIQILLRPDPLAIARELHERVSGSPLAERARSLQAILSDPRVRVALGTLMTSQLVMIGTTSTSPVYLHDHGHHVHTIGLAVSVHLGGMYIASPLSGWLCDRFGRLPMIGLGGLVLIAAVSVAGLAPGSDSALVMLGLFLNGIGWNLAFVSGSALLTDALSPAERTSIQGMADLAMGLMGALGSAAGGMVLGAWGFLTLNALGAACVVGPLIAWLFSPALRRTTERAHASTNTRAFD
ncbi:MAG TPA: MFS transporter [Methylomirabilota bacterium]|nr:MFS transporter [Methylomirabilota bacterium]